MVPREVPLRQRYSRHIWKAGFDLDKQREWNRTLSWGNGRHECVEARMFTRCPRECDLSSLQRKICFGRNNIEVWKDLEGEERRGHGEMQVL